MTVAEADGVKIEPPSVPKLEAKAAKAEEAQETAPPVKRTSKKDEEPAEKKDLSKILDEWDDDDA